MTTHHKKKQSKYEAMALAKLWLSHLGAFALCHETGDPSLPCQGHEDQTRENIEAPLATGSGA